MGNFYERIINWLSAVALFFIYLLNAHDHDDGVVKVQIVGNIAAVIIPVHNENTIKIISRKT